MVEAEQHIVIGTELKNAADQVDGINLLIMYLQDQRGKILTGLNSDLATQALQYGQNTGDFRPYQLVTESVVTIAQGHSLEEVLARYDGASDVSLPGQEHVYPEIPEPGVLFQAPAAIKALQAEHHHEQPLHVDGGGTHMLPLPFENPDSVERLNSFVEQYPMVQRLFTDESHWERNSGEQQDPNWYLRRSDIEALYLPLDPNQPISEANRSATFNYLLREWKERTHKEIDPWGKLEGMGNATFMNQDDAVDLLYYMHKQRMAHNDGQDKAYCLTKDTPEIFATRKKK